MRRKPQLPYPVYRQAILDATDGACVDCILEMPANVNLDEDLRLLALRGRVVVIGSLERVEIDPRDAMARDVDIRGMMLPNTPRPSVPASTGRWARRLRPSAFVR
jgi:threonine dehydrogenase-like Zn-dependent dehydrogenase